ncbi:hypothetical protein [Photobacterium indicum]|uniref:hypothetical protein n=1 Tax=Photobacterium indicum TaxID=81447 RepID=UPI003D147467
MNTNYYLWRHYRKYLSFEHKNDLPFMCFTLPFFCFYTASINANEITKKNNISPSSQILLGENNEIRNADDNTILAWMDDSEDKLADTIHDYSESLDQYVGKEDEDEPMMNRSYLRIKFKPRYSHRGYSDFDANVYLKLDLPHTKRNWKLIFETDPDDFDSLESKQRGISGENDSSSSAVGGVRLQDKILGNWKTNFDIGVKVRWPPDPFVRVNASRVDILSERWTSRIKQEIFFYHEKGPGAVTYFDFYRAMNEDETQIFKASTSGQFLDEDNNWELVQTFEYFDRLNDNHLMEYSIGISADTREEDEISNYWVSASWTQKLYKDWIYLTIEPEIEFPKEYDYHINPGIMLQLELFFIKNGNYDRLNRYIPLPYEKD